MYHNNKNWFVTGRIAIIQFFLCVFLDADVEYASFKLTPRPAANNRLSLFGCASSFWEMIKAALPPGALVPLFELAPVFAHTTLELVECYNCTALLHVEVRLRVGRVPVNRASRRGTLSTYPRLEELPTLLQTSAGAYCLYSVLLHSGNHFAVATHVPDPDERLAQFVWHDAMSRPTCCFVTTATLKQQFSHWKIEELWYMYLPRRALPAH